MGLYSFSYSPCLAIGKVDNDSNVRLVFSIMFRVVSGYRRNMGYSRIDCRAGVFALLVTLPCPYPVGDSSLSLPCGGLFLVPTLWGTLPCPYPVGDSALFPTLLWDR